MSVKFLRIVRGARGLSPAAKAVLRLMADMAGDNGRLWPKQSYLAEETAFSVRTVARALAELETAGWIHRDHQVGQDGRRLADLITIRTPEMAVRHARDQLQMPLVALVPKPRHMPPCPIAPPDTVSEHEAQILNEDETKQESSAVRKAKPPLPRPPVPVPPLHPQQGFSTLRRPQPGADRHILLRRLRA